MNIIKLGVEFTAMTISTVYTHEGVQDLKGAGFTDDRAKVFDLSTLATKADLYTAKAEILQALAETKVDVFRWLFGVTLGLQTVVIIFAVIALSGALKK